MTETQNNMNWLDLPDATADWFADAFGDDLRALPVHGVALLPIQLGGLPCVVLVIVRGAGTLYALLTATGSCLGRTIGRFLDPSNLSYSWIERDMFLIVREGTKGSLLSLDFLNGSTGWPYCHFGVGAWKLGFHSAQQCYKLPGMGVGLWCRRNQLVVGPANTRWSPRLHHTNSLPVRNLVRLLMCSWHGAREGQPAGALTPLQQQLGRLDSRLMQRLLRFVAESLIVSAAVS